MPHQRHLITEAERLYVREGLGCLEIRRELGVPEGTIRHWRRVHKWYEKRQSFERREEELADLLYLTELRLARMVQEDELDPKQVNALAKIVTALRPPGAVMIRKMDKAEAEGREANVEERMARVMEILKGAGFAKGMELRPREKGN